jgi:hypothetical protein
MVTPREYMLKPTGSRIEEYGPSENHLRFLHWVRYHPEKIDGPRQTLIKTLSPGYSFQAPAAEQAFYAKMVSA